MKAAIWHQAKDIRAEEVCLKPHKETEVVVRVAGAGICGSDLHEYLERPISIPVDHKDSLTGGQVPLHFVHEQQVRLIKFIWSVIGVICQLIIQVLNYLNSVVGTEEINLNKLAKIIRDIRVSGVHDRSIGKNGQSHLLINSEEGVYYLNHILTILLKSWLFTIIKMPENSIKNITDNIGITIIKG